MRHPQLLHHQSEVLVEYQRITQVAPEYDRKHVYRVQCKDCNEVLTDRGMNAVLLSDRSVQLYSTDLFPYTVAFIQGDYSAASCTCRVRDIACINCGNVVGYHVNVPCKLCLSQPNNGHYWMFRNHDIKAQQIYIKLGPKGTDLPLLWGFVRDAGDFSEGIHRSGDHLAAQLSCRLTVHFPSCIPLVVHHPTVKVINTSSMHSDKHNHQDHNDSYNEYNGITPCCR